MSDEAQRNFVDTNVLVYAHDTTAGAKRDAARDLIRDLGESRRGCLSLQVLQEFFVNTTRKIPRPLSVQEAREIISDFGLWRRHEPRLEDVLAAVDLHSDGEISFWDAMIVRSAQRLGCSVVWSEDLNAGQVYGGVQSLDPFTP